MMRFLLIICLISLTIAEESDLLRVRRSRSLNRPARRATKGVDNPFEMPEPAEDEPEGGQSSQMCPVSLSDSFDLIRAINNFRITHGLQAVNISRSLMSTACAHMRDITSSDSSINNDCGLHSWSSCCYPSDHSNPNCMHRKALQVTTALKWNVYNVAAYELAYEWAGGPFSSIRALDMFVANQDHKKFILQEDSWSEFKWRSIGASVGDRYAYIWFGTLLDPNGDFDQFNVEGHVMELPGCTCTGSPITWKPTPTLSPEQQAQLERKKKLEAVPSLYLAEAGEDELLLKQLVDNATIADASKNATDATIENTNLPANNSSDVPEISSPPPSTPLTEFPPETVKPSNVSNDTSISNNIKQEPHHESLNTNGTNTTNSSNADASPAVLDSKPSENVKQVSISLSDFLKGLTQG